MSSNHVTEIDFDKFSLEVHYSVSPGEPDTRECPGSDPELEIESCLLRYPALIPGLSIDLQALDLLDEFGYLDNLEAQLWDAYYNEVEDSNEPHGED